MGAIPSITIRFTNTPPRPCPWAVTWRDPKTATAKSRKRSKFFATEAEAIEFRARMIAALKRPDEDPVQTTTTAAGGAGTLAKYLTDWLAHTIKPHRDAGTYRSYESHTRVHLVPTIVDGGRFGDLMVADVKPLKVKALLTTLHGNGIKLPTRKGVLATLSSALGTAVTDEVIETNPCINIGRHLRHKDEAAVDPEPNPMSPAQWAAFMAYVGVRWPDWVEYFT